MKAIATIIVILVLLFALYVLLSSGALFFITQAGYNAAKEIATGGASLAGSIIQ